MGEANGQGIPMGFFLHVSTDGSATENAKEKVLDDFLAYYTKACPSVRFTLSDKELGEVRAMRTAFPKAKHVLCFWHAIRTLETRLADNSAPGSYDPRAAARKFSFIDPTWAPGVTGTERNNVLDLTSGSVRPQHEEEEDIKELEKVR